ncbi:hypothetical protein PMAYCL1PPCAC_04778, partial [Pristionchus mayeri]
MIRRTRGRCACVHQAHSTSLDTNNELPSHYTPHLPSSNFSRSTTGAPIWALPISIRSRSIRQWQHTLGNRQWAFDPLPTKFLNFVRNYFNIRICTYIMHVTSIKLTLKIK